jgi:hypothetical protein
VNKVFGFLKLKMSKTLSFIAIFVFFASIANSLPLNEKLINYEYDFNFTLTNEKFTDEDYRNPFFHFTFLYEGNGLNYANFIFKELSNNKIINKNLF